MKSTRRRGEPSQPHIVIDIAGQKFERSLIVGDQQVIRKHIPEEQKQRVRAKRVKQ